MLVRRLVRGFSSATSNVSDLRPVVDADVLIVGGGPAGLAAAIRLGQLSKQHDRPLNVMLIEKGGEIGILLPSSFKLNGRRAYTLRCSHGAECI
jgi:heterodisulfide reductase subunit A-like polyferredoxin